MPMYQRHPDPVRLIDSRTGDLRGKGGMSTLTDTALENRTEIADSDAKRLRLKGQVAWQSAISKASQLTSTARSSSARTSAARTSAARTSPVPGGPKVRHFRRAGSWAPAQTGWSGRLPRPPASGRQRRTSPNVRMPDPRHRGEWLGGRRQTRRGEGAWPLVVFG